MSCNLGDQSLAPRMIRWLSLIIVCGTIGLFSVRLGHSANEETFQIGDWVGRAHWNQKDKRLDRCSAQLTNPGRITVIYSLDRHYMWTFELSSPSWNFPKGAVFEVGFGTGIGGFFRQRVTALDAQLVRVQLPDTLSAFEAFRKILRLDLVAGGLTSAFDMSFVNEVLTTLTRCVTQRGSTAKTRAAIAAWLKSPIRPAASPGTDPEEKREAAALAEKILLEAQITEAVELKPNEVPAGASGDVIWKVGDSLFTISIMSEETREMGGLTDLIIGGDAQKCRGEFFSGAAPDVIGGIGVARAYTNCQTQQAAASKYYFAFPRKKGGLYLLTTVASGQLTPMAEQSAKEIEGRIRATIMAGLARL